MDSRIKEMMELKYKPAAILFSDDKPEGARQFKEGKWGCVMFMLAAAAKGATAVFDRKTFGCFGGGVGLGFGDQYLNFPGGKECFKYFLSIGNEAWEQGRLTIEKVKAFLRDESLENFVHGEGYIKTPEGVGRFIDCLPMMDVPTQYVVFKPLDQVDPEKEKPEVIVFLVDPDQFSAMVVLANYGRGDNENVFIPYAAGCQTIGIYAYRENASERPRAVAGLTDLSARAALKRQLKDDLLTMAVPYKLFLEMEADAPGSFLERHTWQSLLDMKKK